LRIGDFGLRIRCGLTNEPNFILGNLQKEKKDALSSWSLALDCQGGEAACRGALLRRTKPIHAARTRGCGSGIAD
jgi:hypothetical protein